jgi:AcrR family transcriptional regulator
MNLDVKDVPARKRVRRSSAPLRSESKPALGRRERNKQDKLQRIRRAAAELFHEHGFEKTTTQAIAERADIGAGTLFLYARTKEDLVFLVMDNDIKETMARACSNIPADLSLPEQAYFGYSRLIRYHARNRELSRYYVRARLIPRESHKPSKELAPAPYIVNLFTSVVEQAQQAGMVRTDYTARAISWRLFSLYYWVLVQSLIGHILSEREALAELRQGFEMLFQGIRRTGANRT